MGMVKGGARVPNYKLDATIREAQREAKALRGELIQAAAIVEEESRIKGAEEAAAAYNTAARRGQEPYPAHWVNFGTATTASDSSAALQYDVREHSTGAVRTKDADDVRYDLISPFALERLAKIYAEGATKYGAHNWRKGLPFSNILNHALRHLTLHAQGDRTEDHLAKAAWGLFAIMEHEWTHPEQNDRYFDPIKNA